MITLNADKGLFRVEEWSELEARPGWTNDLDPSQHKLASIIGRYVRADWIRCGLKSCRTPHGKGYVVVTADGLETNIGKDCGKKHFGVDFETMSRLLDRDIVAKEHREYLVSFSFRLDEVEARMDSLREGVDGRGANWVYKHSRPLAQYGRGCPGVVVARIASMVKGRNDMLTVERQATVEEVEQIEAAERRPVERPHYVSVPVARIEGIECLYPENDLRELLSLDLQKHCDEFRALNIDQLMPKQLTQWVRWASSVETKLDRAAEIVEAGCTLLNTSNLSPLRQVLTRREELTEFSEYLKQLS